jgi:SulP family sulfate permease
MQQEGVEPFLSVQSFGPVPIGIVIGACAFVTILLLLENKLAPAGLVVVVAGALLGLLLGAGRSLSDLTVGFHLPEILPIGMPETSTLIVALTVLALPQFPMTVGNAVIAQADLSQEYFGKEARRCTTRAFTTSMGLANVVVALLGGMPLCHGAGGLAAHYRFGARTAGSNLMIGLVFLSLGLLFGEGGRGILSLLPLSVLGALLVFAGSQLAMTILDIRERRDLFVVVLILGLSVAQNLAVGFLAGILLAHLLRWKRLEV